MAVNPKSLANIKPSKKGEVRNPKGKPKGTLSYKTILKKWLSTNEKMTNPITKKTEVLSQYDIVTLAQIAKARKGDTAAYNSLLNRADGMPVQKVEEKIDYQNLKVGYGPEKPV